MSSLPEVPRGAWSAALRRAIPLGLLVLALYAGVLLDLARNWWEDPDYSHGFLIPLLSGYFVWRRRCELAVRAPSSDPAGLWLLAAGLATRVLGELSAEYFVTRASFLITLAGAVLLLLGRRNLRVLLFPLAFLAFMIPLPAIFVNAVSFPLQRLAAAWTAWLLDLLGIPVLLEGNVLRLSHLSLGVTEACSGLRSLLALTAAAAAWGELRDDKPAGRLVLLFLSAPVAVMANMGRVLVTALIAQWFGIGAAKGFFHGFSGWLVFLAAFVALVGLGRVLAWARPAPSGSAPEFDPEIGQSPAGDAPAEQPPARAIWLGALLLAGTLLFVTVRPLDRRIPLRRPLEDFPRRVGDWELHGMRPLDRETAEILDATDVLMWRYENPAGRSVWLYIGFWEQQRRGTTMHSPKNCLPGDGWTPVESGRVSLEASGAGRGIEVNRYVVEKSGRRQLVLYWYDVAGEAIPEEISSRIAMLRNTITAGRTDGALVRVSTALNGSEAEVSEALESFAREVVPLLDGYLPGATAPTR